MIKISNEKGMNEMSKKKKIITIAIISVLIIITLGLRYMLTSIQGIPFSGVFFESLTNDAYKKPNITEKFYSELKKEAIPLKTVNPKEDLSDLEPLKVLLKDKKIIGMGEATHGTKEFFQMKHRTFEFLVKEMGYKVFAIEGSFSAGENINNYVMYGKGNKFEALKSMDFWTWNTKEVMDLIDWMHDYNLGKLDSEKVKFYGYDMQKVAPGAKVLNEYIKKNLSEDYESFTNNTKPFMNELEELKEIKDSKVLAEKSRELKLNLDKIDNFLDINKDKLVSKAGLREYNIAKYHVYTMQQRLTMMQIEDSHEAIDYRDKSMAENVKWILDFEGKDTKALLWAHNMHISKNQDESKWMGSNLKKLYGDKYYSIGFTFSEGSFRVTKGPDTTMKILYSYSRFLFGYNEEWPVAAAQLKKYKYNYLEDAFSKTQLPIFFLDMERVGKNKELKDIINREYLFYNAGAVFTGPQTAIMQIDLTKHFDAIIYVDKTNAAEGL